MLGLGTRLVIGHKTMQEDRDAGFVLRLALVARVIGVVTAGRAVLVVRKSDRRV